MEILKLKNTIKKGEEEIIDFSEPTYMPDINSPNYNIQRIVRLDSDYEFRPDLVSLAFYGNTDKWDMLLKINEISDPLSLREDDLFISLVEEELDEFIVTPEKEESFKGGENIDSKKVSKKDKSRLEILKKISQKLKNGSTANVKTNELQPGQTNITKDSSKNSINF